jgi:hypothetical protein
MFTHFGGRTVGKGIYWNLTSGERVDVDGSAVLPGPSDERYVKLPNAGIMIAGPLAGLLFTVVVPFLCLFVMIMLLPRTVLATGSALSGEAETCLSCHATPGMTMTFKDKTTASAQVKADHFAKSVHTFDCTGCHSDVSLDTHPATQYASRQQFLLHLASACRTCHAEEQLMANPQHGLAITRANAPPCSGCHGSHSITKVPTKQEKFSTTQYCLTCHTQPLSKSIKGETVSLTVQEDWLKSSVHRNHGCADCHTAYSRESHPRPSFGSIRELSLASSETCKRCHFDKAVQHTGSIHAKLLGEGNQRAPVCTDCHGSHQVGPKALALTLGGQPCRKCHPEIFEAYKGSIHGIAKEGGMGHAPLCSSCHFAHDVKPAMASRSPKDVCLGCHPDVSTAHQKWLPNTEAHFDAVACTACHVPGDYKRSIYLRVTDGSSGMLLSDTVVRKILETGRAVGKNIDPGELWKLYQNLNEGRTVNMTGMVSLKDHRQVHYLAPKERAVRQCEWCHSANSAFFQSVAVAVATPDGRETVLDVDPAALSSLYAMVPLNEFYVLGSTRVRAMDYLGAAMILGGIAVPIAHGTLRLLTARLRRARQHH